MLHGPLAGVLVQQGGRMGRLGGEKIGGSRGDGRTATNSGMKNQQRGVEMIQKHEGQGKHGAANKRQKTKRGNEKECLFICFSFLFFPSDHSRTPELHEDIAPAVNHKLNRSN